MKPLGSIAMGLVIVVLVARFAGFDALPDPLGWLLVLWGVRRLPDPSVLVPLAVVAFVVACAVWFPSNQEVLAHSDPSLQWVANLPQVAFCVLLCRSLAALAVSAGDTGSAAWLRTTMVLNLALAIAPVLAFASDSVDLLPALEAAAAGVVLLLIVVLFACGSRPWARGSVPADGS